MGCRGGRVWGVHRGGGEGERGEEKGGGKEKGRGGGRFAHLTVD